MTRAAVSLRWLIAASTLLTPLCACKGTVGESPSGDAMHTTADVQNMKFVMGFLNARGELCRVVEQPVVINGQKMSATSTLCQQADGRWAVQR
jgi:hypothetical protein